MRRTVVETGESFGTNEPKLSIFFIGPLRFRIAEYPVGVENTGGAETSESSRYRRDYRDEGSARHESEQAGRRRRAFILVVDRRYVPGNKTNHTCLEGTTESRHEPMQRTRFDQSSVLELENRSVVRNVFG